MRAAVLVLVSAVLASGCGVVHQMSNHGTEVKGSGVSKSEERQVGEFNRIEIYNSADVVARVGPATKVIVEGDDNVVTIIETIVVEGALRIKSEKSYSSDKPLRITIESPHLEGISINGSGDARIEGVNSDRFQASIAGAGDVTVSGTAKYVDASIAGSGDIDLSDLKAETADASISGSGDIKVHATQTLDASIVGSGDIRYFGKPGKVNQSVVGSGDIHSG